MAFGLSQVSGLLRRVLTYPPGPVRRKELIILTNTYNYGGRRTGVEPVTLRLSPPLWPAAESGPGLPDV